MFSNCANPKCCFPFDYRMRGQFFRFPQAHADATTAEHTHSVVHFWLCGRCCPLYTLDYHEGRSFLCPRDAQELPAQERNIADEALVP